MGGALVMVPPLTGHGWDGRRSRTGDPAKGMPFFAPECKQSDVAVKVDEASDGNKMAAGDVAVDVDVAGGSRHRSGGRRPVP